MGMAGPSGAKRLGGQPVPGWPSALDVEQAEFVGAGDGFGAVGDGELVEDRLDMALDGFRADAQRAAKVLPGEPATQMAEHFEFARAEGRTVRIALMMAARSADLHR